MKSSLLWLFLVVGLVLHVQYEAAEYVFYSKALSTEGDGTLPVFFQVFNLLVLVIPLIMAVVHLVCAPKWFITISLIYAGLFVLLNVFHLVETVGKGFDNFLQIILLTLVLVVNGLLVKSLLGDRKTACC